MVIREGKVRIWRDPEILEIDDKPESYFEVIVNRKVIQILLDNSESRKSITLN